MLVPMAVLWAFIPTDGIALITDWFIHKFIELTLELPYRDVEQDLMREIGSFSAFYPIFL